MNLVLATIIMVSSSILFARGQVRRPFIFDISGKIQDNMTLVEKWQNLENHVKKASGSTIKALLPILMESSGNLNISSQCRNDILHLLTGIKDIKAWAFRFIDSSAKIIDGLLTGSMSSFGAYDECVDTMVTSERSSHKGKYLFRGKYCTIDIVPPLPPKPNLYKLDEVLPELKNFSEGGTVISEAAKYAQFFYFLSLKLGICVPSGCKEEDIDHVLRQVRKRTTIIPRVSRCEIKKENEFTPMHIFVISAYSLTGLFLFIGSAVDIYAFYWKKTFRSTWVRVLLCFSMITNFQKFSNTKTSSDTLSCLNGIRFLSMSWVVLGHNYLSANFNIFLGLENVKDYAKDFAFQAVINAYVAVDTFFCIGGLLVCYVTIKHVKKGGHPFNVTLYIIHRLWRILPVYSYVIMFMFLRDMFGSGPIFYDTTEKYIQACRVNWWTNLLFINNFYHADQMCILQSWYIASDMQLYLGTLLILLPLLRWPKVGITLCVINIAASIVYSGIATYVFNFPPTILFAYPDPGQRMEYWVKLYFRPFVHAGPYCVGMLAGYLLAMKPDLKIPRGILVVGWCLAFVSNFSVLYGVVNWNRGVDPSFWGGLLYASLHRTAWALGVAWMIICCSTGHGGVINYILSWKVFVPLGRLTFIVYLIHTTVQIAIVGNVRTQVQPDHWFAVWMFFGNMCATYGIAFAGSMLVESPLMALEKIMFRKGDKKTDDATVVRNNTILKGTTEKNGDIAVIVPSEQEDPFGIDNKAAVY